MYLWQGDSNFSYTDSSSLFNSVSSIICTAILKVLYNMELEVVGERKCTEGVFFINNNKPIQKVYVSIETNKINFIKILN